MAIGDRVLALRRAGGMSQEQLAEKLGVSRQAVSKWETGESMPDIDKVVQMSVLFGVTTDSLLLDAPAESAQDEAAMAVSSDDAKPGEPSAAAVQAYSRHKLGYGMLLAGWISAGLGALGLLVIWVLSTMTETYGSYVYTENGVMHYTMRLGYTFGGFVTKYRLGALVGILCVLAAVGAVLLLAGAAKRRRALRAG